MHFDEIYQDNIGIGIVQRYTVFCCFLVGFVEGFLSTGIWFLAPYLVLENHLEWFEQSYLYLPFLIGIILGHIIFGGISDVSGRRTSLKGSCVICYVASIFAAVFPDLGLYQNSSVALGFSLAGIQSGCRILLFETLPMNNRGAYIVAIDIITNLGSLFALGWAWATPKFGFLETWQLFFYASAVLTIVGTCFVDVMPYSIRQMICYQLPVSVNVMLRKFYALNKGDEESSCPNNVIDQFTHIEVRQYRREQCSDYFMFHLYGAGSYLWSIISAPFIMSTIFLSIFHVCFFDSSPLLNTLLSERLRSSNKDCVFLFNNKTSFSHESSNVENYYLMLSSLFAAIIMFFVADRWPRNLITGFCCSFAAVCAFALIHRFQFYFELPITLGLIFFHTSTSIILNILTFEMYPTKFRGTAHGVLKSFSYFGVLAIILNYQKTCVQLFILFYYAIIAFILGATGATSYPNRNRKPIVE